MSASFHARHPVPRRILWGLIVGVCLRLVVPTALAEEAAAPELMVEHAPPASTTDSHVLVSGVARSADVGIKEVRVLSNRLGEVALAATLDASGVFQADVPLLLGQNHLTFRAVDRAGNLSAASGADVLREKPAIPVLSILAPTGADLETTEARVTVRGTVLSSLSPSDFRVELGDARASVRVADGVYEFEFRDVPLGLGPNVLSVGVYSALGAQRAQVVVRRVSEASSASATPPTLELPVRSAAIFTSDALFSLSGSARGDCVRSIEINGAPPAHSVGLGTERATFDADFPLSEAVTLDLLVSATSCAGATSTRAVHITRDSAAPRVVVTEPVLPDGELGVVDNPFRIAGSISEPNLAGATLNGQALVLSPSAQAGKWDFVAALRLDRDVPTDVRIEAWDKAGERAARSFTVRLKTAVELQITTPAVGERLLVSDGASSLSVVAHVTGGAASDKVYAALRGGQSVLLATSGADASGVIQGLDAGDKQELTVWVVGADGQTVARSTQTFNAVSADSIPVGLVRQDPADGTTAIEANATLSFHFNRPLDPQKLEIHVLETAHGLVYKAPEPGADLRTHSAVERVRVDHDREPVPGRLQNVPGNRSFVFYPAREWAYGADVIVEASYQGSSVFRSQVRVRDLPTLAYGFVVTTDRRPVVGVSVELPELGYSAVTNHDGGFDFGWGWDASRVLPEGRHRMLINARQANSGFGSVERWLLIRKGEINQAGSIALPEAGNDLSFVQTRSGTRNVLMRGALVLDATQGGFVFPDGSAEGSMAAQVVPGIGTGYLPPDGHLVLFALSLLPSGVSASGQLSISFDLPARAGKYEYLGVFPQSPNYVPYALLYAVDPDTLALAPAGLLQVDADARRAFTVGPVSAKRLDALAFGVLPGRAYQAAVRFAKGQATFVEVVAAMEGSK